MVRSVTVWDDECRNGDAPPHRESWGHRREGFNPELEDQVEEAEHHGRLPGG